MSYAILQSAVRAITGTALTYEGDWHAYLDKMGVPAGDFAGRMTAIMGLPYSATENLMLTTGVPTLAAPFTVMNSLPSTITFARADATQCATYFGSNGLLQTAAANIPRFDYDPATLLPRGLLIEESRQNLLLQSRDMTQAAWTKTDVTPARTQVGLDGVANTACLMTEGSAGTAQTFQGGTISAGATITGSLVLKRGNTDWVRFLLWDGAIGADGWFNLATGAVGATAARSTGSGISSSITNLGGGWYRCSLTVTLTGSIATSASLTFLAAAANSSTARVNGATYIVDCAGLEVGAFATSIIPTTTTALTRAADSASMTGTNFSSWFNASAGTFVVEGAPGQSNPKAYSFLVEGQNPVNTPATVTMGSGGSSSKFGINVRQNTGVGNNSNEDIAYTYVAGTPLKAAASYDSTTNGGMAFNGATVTATLNSPSNTATSLSIGSRGTTGNRWNGWVRSLRYYPSKLPDATLVSLTA